MGLLWQAYLTRLSELARSVHGEIRYAEVRASLGHYGAGLNIATRVNEVLCTANRYASEQISPAMSDVLLFNFFYRQHDVCPADAATTKQYR